MEHVACAALSSVHPMLCISVPPLEVHLCESPDCPGPLKKRGATIDARKVMPKDADLKQEMFKTHGKNRFGHRSFEVVHFIHFMYPFLVINQEKS